MTPSRREFLKCCASGAAAWATLGLVPGEFLVSRLEAAALPPEKLQGARGVRPRAREEGRRDVRGRADQPLPEPGRDAALADGPRDRQAQPRPGRLRLRDLRLRDPRPRGRGLGLLGLARRHEGRDRPRREGGRRDREGERAAPEGARAARARPGVHGLVRDADREGPVRRSRSPRSSTSCAGRAKRRRRSRASSRRTASSRSASSTGSSPRRREASSRRRSSRSPPSSRRPPSSAGASTKTRTYRPNASTAGYEVVTRADLAGNARRVGEEVVNHLKAPVRGAGEEGPRPPADAPRPHDPRVDRPLDRARPRARLRGELRRARRSSRRTSSGSSASARTS